MATSKYELKEREAFSSESPQLEPSAPFSPDVVTVEAPPLVASHDGVQTDSSLASYGDVANHPTAPPPSYDSLFSKVKEIKEEADGPVDFISKVCEQFISSLFYLWLMGILLILPVGMLIFGSLYLYDCPAEDYIPIYLIVAGAVGIIRGMISFVWRCNKCLQRNVPEGEKKKTKGKSCVMLIDLFIFSWFIAGNVWIYQIHGYYNREDPKAYNYCHPILYDFAFWATTSVYIVICAMIVCLMCGICLMCCCELISHTSSD